jgi:GNAT superfamily N-acetyltransferase
MEFPGYGRDLDIVALTPDGTIASYVNNWTDPLNRVGVCGPVGTRAAHRRRGLARACLLESFRRLRAHGMDRVIISTGESNTPARRLYESLGLTVASAFLDYAKP